MGLRWLGAAASVALLMASTSARADVTFDLDNVVFTTTVGGSTSAGDLTGSFTTSDDLSEITGYDLTASSATTIAPFAGYEYTQTDSTVTASTLPSQYFQIDAIGGAAELRLDFATPLTSAGTTLDGTHSYESEFLAGDRFPSGGVVAAGSSPVSAAPEPSAWGLMLAGVAMAGAMLRSGRRKDAGAVA